MDQVILNPDHRTLLTLVPKAIAAANKNVAKARHIARSDSVISKAVAEVMASPSGSQYWRRGRKTNERRSLVTLAWWSDPLGRKHVRIAGITSTIDHAAHNADPDDRPAVWHVYPQSCLKTGPHWRDALMVCGCGVVGTVESIAWMGDRCGPCHDRAEEGGPSSAPWVIPGMGAHPTRDGRAIVYYHDGELVHHDLTTNTKTTVATSFGEIWSAVCHPTKPECCVIQYSGCTRWNWESGNTTKKKGQEFGLFVFSPDGQWCMDQGGTYHAIEWEKRGDPLGKSQVLPRTSTEFLNFISYQAPPYTSGIFAPDGRWVGITRSGRIEAVDLATRYGETLREGPSPQGDDPGLFGNHARAHVYDLHWDSQQMLLGFDYGNYEIEPPCSLVKIDSEAPYSVVEVDVNGMNALPVCMRFTPDGRWVVMPTITETPRNAVWFYPLNGGPRRELAFTPMNSTESLQHLTFSEDGEWMFATMVFDDNADNGGVIRRFRWRSLLS